MADLDFLSLHPSDASIAVTLPDGTVSRIPGVSTVAIADKCPLLFHCFDDGPWNDKQAGMEATSVELIRSFLRFLYTGTYLSESQQNRPCSLLHHAELRKMAQDYDLPELQVAAHVNFMHETEQSCYVPTPPMDLCLAIDFVYKHLYNEQPLVDNLLNYCVTSFKYHGLGNDAVFRQLAFENPSFHRDLCRTNWERGFESEGAADIIRLPVCRSNPRSVFLQNQDFNVDKRTHAEFQFSEWYDSEIGGSDNETDTDAPPAAKRCKTTPTLNLNLAHRPKEIKNIPSQQEVSPNEDDGFTMVFRPRITLPSTPSPTTADAPFGFQLVNSASDSEAPSVTPDLTLDGESDSDWTVV